MSRPISDQVFKLIKSLDSGEKRVFRTNNPDERAKYRHLFDVLERSDSYEENRILKKCPDILPHQLSNLKAHLTEKILSSLLSQTASSKYDLRITELLGHARVLYERCLYEDALQLLQKAKRIATETDNRLVMLEIIELEKMAILQGGEELTEQSVRRLLKDSNESSRLLRSIQRLSDLSLELNSMYRKLGFIRDPEELKMINDFFKKFFIEREEMSYQEQIYALYCKTGYQFFIQDFEGVFINANKWVQLFENNPKLIAFKTELYLKSLNSLLVAQNKLFLLKDFEVTHRKLLNLKRSRKIQLARNENLTLFRTIYLHEFNRHFMKGDFKGGIKIISRLEKELNEFLPLLDKNTVLLFHYKTACLYFGNGDFGKALKHRYLIISEPDSTIRQDLQSFSRILQLICYFELGDQDRMEYCIISTYRFLSKTRNFIRYHGLITQFLRNLEKQFREDDAIKNFTRLKKEMQKLERDPFEKRAFIYFDMISWLESKIEKRSVQEVISEKSLKKIKD